MKRCTTCKEVKPLDEFQKDSTRGDGLQARCRECGNAYKRQWAADHPERCAICGTDEPGGQFNNWHVDHDHETNQVRGLLCTSCNVGIRLLKEDTFILESALVYLQQSKS